MRTPGRHQKWHGAWNTVPGFSAREPMTTNDSPAQESAGTTDEPTVRITGPHPGEDQYGRIDHYYYRCEHCGAESVDKADFRWCC